LYKKGKADTRYLYETSVENLFINEYMPDAPSDYVKVYLLALMYAQTGVDASDAELASALRMDGAQTAAAWKYWEDVGAVYRDGDDIVFTSMREQLYGISRDGGKGSSGTDAEERGAGDSGNAAGSRLSAEERSRLFTSIEMMTGNTLNYRDIEEINSWLDEFGASAETVKLAYRYCTERGSFNSRYVAKIVLDWTERGLDTAGKIEEYLSENDLRRQTYKRIMKALGFVRRPTEKEREIMDRWLDELNCSIDEILDACGKTSGISSPNFNYVNKVIESSRKVTGRGAGISRAQVLAYYDSMREKEEEEAKARTEEVYESVPKIRDIDNEILELNSKLLSAVINGGRGVEEGRARLAELGSRRDALLTKHNIPIDYMKPRRRCNICGDTGLKEDGSLCSCFGEIAREAKADLASGGGA
jgi:DnaD/phage-associated family protein